jgi:1,2-phenylacetyl-CoA epoxidase PaaB subunit
MTEEEIEKILEQCDDNDEYVADIIYHFEKMKWHKRKLREIVECATGVARGLCE